jgi:hypothetical protein
MKTSIQWLVLVLCILGAATAEASQLVPIEASKLEALSDVVLVGTVKTIERDADNTIPKDITDYDIVTVEVAFVLKGAVSTKEVKVRLATRGSRAFDPALTKLATATFFLKKAKDGVLSTAYPGSVAVFPTGYFKGTKKKDSEPPAGDDGKPAPQP